MLTTIIIFAISLGLVAFMIGRKINAIRSGKIVLTEEGIHPEALLADFDFTTWKSDIVYYTKIYGHRVVLSILKQWIKFSFWIREQKEKRFPKKEILEGQVEPAKSPFAQFVSTIGEYKNHLKNVARKVKEREERKRE